MVKLQVKGLLRGRWPSKRHGGNLSLDIDFSPPNTNSHRTTTLPYPSGSPDHTIISKYRKLVFVSKMTSNKLKSSIPDLPPSPHCPLRWPRPGFHRAPVYPEGPTVTSAGSTLTMRGAPTLRRAAHSRARRGRVLASPSAAKTSLKLFDIEPAVGTAVDSATLEGGFRNPNAGLHARCTSPE